MNLEQEIIQMLKHQIFERGIRDPRVLDAMHDVPRHFFVPEESLAEAYADHPIHLPEEYATISQPYIVAYMTEMLQCRSSDRVLEIGTGSGYHAAILSFLCKEVYTLERHYTLSISAMRTLSFLGRCNVFCKVGDCLTEWQEKAPFDKIVVTAAAQEPPAVLLDQLVDGGTMIIPLGDASIQTLTSIQRKGNEFTSSSLIPCVFVPLIVQKQLLTEREGTDPQPGDGDEDAFGADIDGEA